MKSLPWIALLCQGWRQSQIKTFTALWEAFIRASTSNLNSIARSLTATTGVGIRHTLKRLWRFLSNKRLNEEAFYQNLVNFVWTRVQHWSIVPIAIDWTHCEKHECWQSLVASIVMRGRGIPILVWSFHEHDFSDDGSRSAVEAAFIRKLKQLLPPTAASQTVVILADRGFASAEWFKTIRDAGLHFCVRLKTGAYFWYKGCCHLLDRDMINPGERLLWQDVFYPDSRAIKLERITATCATPKAGKEKDPWFLASSLAWEADRLIDLYAKRMVIEEDFRTAKTELNWKHSRIRKLEHYRRFVLFMVACLVFSMLIGCSAQRKPSLIDKVVRRRKGKWDSCSTRIGLLLLQMDMGKINHLALMNRLPA